MYIPINPSVIFLNPFKPCHDLDVCLTQPHHPTIQLPNYSRAAFNNRYGYADMYALWGLGRGWGWLKQATSCIVCVVIVMSSHQSWTCDDN